jgi:hypothetical protein
MEEQSEVTMKVDTMYKDLYIGAGKLSPSLFSRVTLMEDQLDRMNKNLSKMVWLLLAIFGTGVVDTVMRYAK